jgi:hypothetical protein
MRLVLVWHWLPLFALKSKTQERRGDMTAKISTQLTHETITGIGQALQKLGWVAYSLEKPHEKWIQVIPSDSLILLKQLEDYRYENLDNVPYFLLSQVAEENGLYTIVFPTGKDFNTMQELLMWADSF